MPPFITSRCKKLNGLIGAVNDRLIKIECAGEQAEEADKTALSLPRKWAALRKSLITLGTSSNGRCLSTGEGKEEFPTNSQGAASIAKKFWCAASNPTST